MFNWFSLDYIYYPVSGIMWLWYKLFALILGPNNFFAWALTVMLPLIVNVPPLPRSTRPWALMFETVL